jgi:hypothetical protein
MAAALDREALYYPYIHIRSVEWLKATLLCFPQLRRIMPSGFQVEDPPEVSAFRKINGAGGEPLLVEEYTDVESVGSPIRDAQERLLRLLQQNEQLVKEKYSLTGLEKLYAETPYAGYRLHTGKMMYELGEYLTASPLAVRTKKPGSYSEYGEKYGDWIMVNEDLGEIIMSLIAIAIAKHKGLDIVTSSGTLHHALAVLDEDEVFRRLIGDRAARVEISVGEKVDELVEVVMTSHFDLSKLTASQIGELARNGKDLRAFKAALVPLAETIPDILDAGEREKKLKWKAAEVIEEWRKYKKSLPRFALDALLDSTEVKFPEFAAAIIAGGTGLELGSGSGLAIGLLTWKGLGIWRKFKEHTSSPYSYLTRIQRAGAALVLAPPA